MVHKWIAGATKNKGALHRRLGVPANKTIPAKMLARAAKHHGIEGKEARLAETLRHLHHRSVGKGTHSGRPR